MREQTRVVYKYALLVLAVAMSAFAVARFRSQPPIAHGSLTTRWRAGGDVVERCTSCHKDPHQPEQDALLKTHPVAEFGCVSCHGGNSSGTDLSAHDGLFVVNKNEASLSVSVGEAACGRCHRNEEKLATKDGVDLAPHLSKGRKLFQVNCAGCHDPNAEHDRGIPTKWMITAATPTAIMSSLASTQPGMPNVGGADQAGRDEVQNVIAWLASLGEISEVRGYANVPGATADEGKEIFEAYGCKGCHAAGLGDFAGKNTEDFIAYYIQNPARVNRGAKMPSLRLTRREAASVAKFVSSFAAPPVEDAESSEAATSAFQKARAKCSDANDVEVTHAECGAKIAAHFGCDSCHAEQAHPDDHAALSKAPDLTTWGASPPTRERLEAAKKSLSSPKHPPIRIEEDFDDLLVAMASMTNVQLTADFDPTRADYFQTVRGDELLEDRQCLTCHQRSTKDRTNVGAANEPRAKVPSLFGEGAHVQPEWLLAFLRDPETNGVRPPLHPEWVWGEIVPTEKMAVRMPSYFLSNEDATAIVRALAKNDGGDFPYADIPTPALSTSDILSALVHVNGAADSGGNCFSCHYLGALGALPIGRAKTNLDLLAPDLGKIAKRLRPWFVADLLAKPQDFIEGMPALWPDATGAPLAWTIPSDASPKKSASDQVALVRDFLFLLRDETRLPRSGDELKTPILGLAASSDNAAPPPAVRP